MWTTEKNSAQVGSCRVSAEVESCNRSELLGFGAATLAQPATRAEHINFQTADEERVWATCGNSEPADEDLVDRVMLDVASNHPTVRKLRSEHRDGNAAPSHGVLGRHRESRDPAVLVGRADRRNAS